jgi:hypothetical protein
MVSSEKRCEVLSRIYGEERVRPLHAVLRALLSVAAPRLETLRRGDSEAYRRLLLRTLVATPSPAGASVQPLPATTSLQQLSTQPEVVRRAAEWLLRGGGASSQVLCAGDGSRGPTHSLHRPRNVGAPEAPQWTHVNAAADALKVRRPCSSCSASLTR